MSLWTHDLEFTDFHFTSWLSYSLESKGRSAVSQDWEDSGLGTAFLEDLAEGPVCAPSPFRWCGGSGWFMPTSPDAQPS